MDVPSHSGTAFSFSDPMDRRIHRRLRLVSEGSAAFFRDACQLMHDECGLQSRTHVVAHLLREIESAMRRVLLPTSWKRDAHEPEVREALCTLDISEDDEIARIWLELPGSDNDYGLAARAHRDGLAYPRPVDWGFRSFWDEMRTLLDGVLDRFEAQYAAYEKRLQDLVAVEHPDSNHVGIVTQRAPNSNRALERFYAKLTNPEWLPLLRKHGIFDEPYEPEVDPESGEVRSRGWPPSACLRSFASCSDEVAAEVVEVALSMQDTRNMWVQNDVVMAATAMINVGIAAELVPCICEWLSEPHFYITHPTQDLALRLAAEGEPEGALELARAVLHIEVPQHGGDGRPRLDPDSVSRLKGTDHIRAAERLADGLSPHAPWRTLALMCDLLEVAAEVAYGSPPSKDRRDDSHWWRRAVENHEQNMLARLPDGLVVAVRSIVERIALDDPASVPKLVELLEARSWRIFDRLALHVLRLDPEGAPDLIAARLADPDLVDDADTWHEYALLLRDCFPGLADGDKEAVVALAGNTYSADAVADEGTDPDTGRPYTPRRAAQLADYRALRRLALIRDQLPEPMQARFAEVEAECGPVDHPEFLVYVSSSSGWATPATTDELVAMTDAQIIETLGTPLARTSHRSPAPRGLARQLQACVKEEPERFARMAPGFVGLDPTYVCALIMGLGEAAAKDKCFPWEPVLDLCRWTLDQPRVLGDRTWPDGDQDAGWEQTWRWIGDLLCKGLHRHDDGIPYACREAVAEVISVLARDPDPAPSIAGDGDRDGGSCAMEALNSVRGSALHALIQYALWCNEHIARKLDLPEGATVGFGHMPEVAAILDERLAEDESLAIRSVYGERLPWLHLLDAEWTAANLPRILPPDADNRRVWDAAWQTYIAFCHPYTDMLTFLEPEYRRAVRRLVPNQPQNPSLDHPDGRLAEHLHMFYLRGTLDLGEPTGLLNEFHAAAGPGLRTSALDRVGWWMQDDQPPSEAVVARAVDLWEWRVAQCLELGEADELAAFSTWLSAAAFDAEWALKHMRNALQLGAPMDHAWTIAKDLARLAQEEPALSLDCLALVLERVHDAPHLHLSDSDVEQVIQSALDCADPGIKLRAKELANRLVARGWARFGELAQQDGDPQQH